MQYASFNNEKDLLRAIAEGDEKAFTHLVDLYWNTVYSHALAYAKSSVRAQEITQDVFLKVWKKRSLLKEVADFKNFLFVLGRNQIVSALRKKLEDPVSADPIEQWSATLSPDQQLELKETYHVINEAIEKLPPVRQMVFKLSRLENLSYDEIATRLDISKNTVKEHIVLALGFLRRYVHMHGNVLFIFITCSNMLG